MFVKELSKKISNPFWREVLCGWMLYIGTFKPEDLSMGCTTSFKSDFTKYKTTDINQWVQKGLMHFNDLRKSSGEMMSFAEVKEVYK